MQLKNKINKWRKRMFEIVEVATPEDKASRAYDLLNMITIVINLIVSLAYTLKRFDRSMGGRSLRWK